MKTIRIAAVALLSFLCPAWVARASVCKRKRVNSSAMIQVSSRSPLKHFALCILVKVVCVGFLAMGALIWLPIQTSAETRIWTGSANSFWSEPGNWNPAGAPQNGDSLIFPTSATRYDSQNDISNPHLGSISLAGGGYNLTGNSILLDSNLTDSHSNGGSNRVSFTIYFSGAAVVNVVGAQQGPLLDLYGQLRPGGGGDLTILVDAIGAGGQPGSLTLHEAIVGSGAVVKRGRGTLYFRNINPNVYYGGTYLLEGTTYLVATRSVPTDPGGRLVIGSNDVSQATVYAGKDPWVGDMSIEVNDSHLVFQYDTGTTVLRLREGALVDGPGSLTIYGGVESTSDFLTPVINLPFNIYPALTFFNMRGANYSGIDIQTSIGGPGGINKAGNSALVLQHNNSFSGNVTVYGGILDASGAGSLGAGTNVTLYGTGSLTLRNAAVGGKTLDAYTPEQIPPDLVGTILTSIGSSFWSGAVVLHTNLVILGGDMAFTGPISGAGGMIFLNGISTLGGSAGNTFTGTILVRSSLLQFNKPSGVNAYSGPLVVGGPFGGPYETRWLHAYQNVGANLTLYANGIVNLNNFNEDFGYVTFNGGQVNTGTGQFAIYQPLTVNASSASAVINGYLGLPAGDARAFIVGDGSADCDLIVNAVMFGGATYFVKQGAGTMCLTAPNSFTGVTLLEGGILDINNAAGLGNSGAGTVIFDGATLRLNGSDTLAENFEVVGAGLGGTHGAMEVPLNSSWTLTGSILMDAASTFNVGQTAGFGLNGIISGPGSLIKTGLGNLVLGGTANNTYAGDTFINGGALYLNKPTAFNAIPKSVIVGSGAVNSPATLVHLASYLVGSSVTVNRGGLWDLNGQSEGFPRPTRLNPGPPLTLNGGRVQTGTGVLYLPQGGNVVVNPGVSGNSSSSISGYLSLDPGAHRFSVSAGSIFGSPECTVSAVISQTSTAAQLVKDGAGTLRLTGANTYTGATTINAGTLGVDGLQPQSSVELNAGARLQGSGTVGPITISGSASVIAPGASPGVLTCANFNTGALGGSTLEIELNGVVAGASDQLNVVGTVNLSGVSLNASLNFASAVNNQFTIINNDGADATIGTFNGMPQNASLYIGGEKFSISYAGGTGNDVILTRLVTPPLPSLTIERIDPRFVRLLWLTNDPAFTLQSTTNLNDSSWPPVTPAPTVIGGNNVVTNAATNTQIFYRLKSP